MILMVSGLNIFLFICFIQFFFSILLIFCFVLSYILYLTWFCLCLKWRNNRPNAIEISFLTIYIYLCDTVGYTSHDLVDHVGVENTELKRINAWWEARSNRSCIVTRFQQYILHILYNFFFFLIFFFHLSYIFFLSLL